MGNNSIHTPYISFELDESLLIGIYEPGVVINLNIAKKIATDRLKLIQERSYPSLIDVRGVRSIDKESRDYFARGEGIKGIVALAVLVENAFSQILGNVFITFSKPEIPTKLFKNRDQALLWLKQYINR